MIGRSASSAATVTVACLLTLGIVTHPAAAQDEATVCLRRELNPITRVAVCQRWGRTDRNGDLSSDGAPFGGQSPGWSPPADHVWVSWWAVISRFTAGQCYYREGGWFHEAIADTVVAGEGTAIQNDLLVLAMTRGEVVPCVRDDLLENLGPPAMVEAQQVWDAVSTLLPRPEPAIPPGRAVTGVAMWLTTGRPLRVELDDQGLATLPGGLVDVTAEATFVVDWGDGTSDGPFDRPGIPYDEDDEDDPAGIRHVWTDKGSHELTVTDTWTVAFTDQWGRSDQVSGTLSDTATIPTVEMVMVGN